jgi:DNA processing protein
MAKKGCIFLNLAKISLKKIKDIISFLNDPDDIFKLKLGDLKKIPSLTEKDIEKILSLRKSDILEEELRMIEKNEIKIIDLFDPNYPSFLKEIAYPPLVLYIKGDLELLNNKILFAIVGTRRPTIYGINMAYEYAYKLASLGLVIVSGLAKGVDTMAHKGALDAGTTVAVLGSGLLSIYPKENKKLAEEIGKKGCLISEFPLKEPPFKENFPRRNRIISGVSRGVLVIEAAEKSGALITAHLACEQNREVFALPGKVDSSLSKGTHLLIKEGAKLVDRIEDILEELNLNWEEVKEENLSLSSQEREIFDIITKEGKYLEEIILESKKSMEQVNKIVLDLQLKGLIKELKPSYFVKIR